MEQRHVVLLLLWRRSAPEATEAEPRDSVHVDSPIDDLGQLAALLLIRLGSIHHRDKLIAHPLDEVAGALRGALGACGTQRTDRSRQKCRGQEKKAPAIRHGRYGLGQ